MVVCLPGAKLEAITERVENIMGSGMGGSVLVHVGTNNVEREGTTAIVRKYRNLVRTLKQTWVEQVILSGILPVIGRSGNRYRNCRGMAINMLVEKLCMDEEVGFVNFWGSFVGRADMYMKDGLHLSGKGVAVFADGLSSAVDSGMGSISNIFGSKHYLTRFNKIVIQNNKFQMASGQGSHWLIESPTISSSMCSPPLSYICQFYF